MAFQFHCPQGHLLSAHEYQAGQQTHCPMCGMALIIPLPTVMMPPTPTVMFPYSPVGGPPPAPPEMSSLPPAAEPEAPVTDRFAALAAAAKAAEAEAADAEKPPEPAAEAPPVEPAVLHIPCPKGHVLETPEDMLDQEVLCPHCQAQFVLRRRNSVEFRQKKEEEERIREFKTGKFWLNMAIVVVVLVVLGLVALIVVRNLMHTPVSNQNRSAQLVREAASTLARHAARRHRHPTAVQPLISGGHSSLLKNEIASIRQPG
jgi:hypothetical protein